MARGWFCWGQTTWHGQSGFDSVSPDPLDQVPNVANRLEIIGERSFPPSLKAFGNLEVLIKFPFTFEHYVPGWTAGKIETLHTRILHRKTDSNRGNFV